MTLALHPSFRRCFTDDVGRWRYPPGLLGEVDRVGVGIADTPPELFDHALADAHAIARSIARALEAGAVGCELWDGIDSRFVDVAYDDKGRLDRCRLATFQAVHGNRKSKGTGTVRRHLRSVPAPQLALVTS